MSSLPYGKGRSRATDGDLIWCAVLWCSRRMSGKHSPYLLTYTELSLRANFFLFLSFLIEVAFFLFHGSWLVACLLLSYIDR